MSTTFHTRYKLYIRYRDGRVRLVNAATGKPVEIAALFPLSRGGHVLVQPRGETSVTLMEDEVQHVDEFPEVQEESEARG